MGSIVFITGTDTGVGKSLITALLVRLARDQGVHALAMKPFATGDRGDAEVLRRAQDGELTLEQINPYFFRKPLAPLHAARLEGKRASKRGVAQRIRSLSERCEVLFVEGCGGLMVPVAAGLDILDLITDLSRSVLIVAANRLGTINHIRLTVSVLESKGITPRAILLSDLGIKDASVGTNGAVLRELLSPIPVVEVPFQGKNALAESGFARVCKNCERFLKKPLVLSGVSGSFNGVRPSGGRKRSVTEKSLKKLLTESGSRVK